MGMGVDMDMGRCFGAFSARTAVVNTVRWSPVDAQAAVTIRPAIPMRTRASTVDAKAVLRAILWAWRECRAVVTCVCVCADALGAFADAMPGTVGRAQRNANLHRAICAGEACVATANTTITPSVQ